jgi:hypothetical protein
MTASKGHMRSLPETVWCEVCVKQILLLEAVTAEGDETALHFCGIECQAACGRERGASVMEAFRDRTGEQGDGGLGKHPRVVRPGCVLGDPLRRSAYRINPPPRLPMAVPKARTHRGGANSGQAGSDANRMWLHFPSHPGSTIALW